MTPTWQPLGDRALLLRFGNAIDAATSARVLAAWRHLATAQLPGIVDLVPAYASLTVHYDWQALPEAARATPWSWLAEQVLAQLREAASADAAPGRLLELPVCYDPPHAPDLDEVASLTGLSADAVVRRHGAVDYVIAFLGFRPGFPYLLGLDAGLSVPRLATPRAQVAAGSVGIGGAQTGIYPGAGPGGWRLIGRTPWALFDAARDPPCLLAPGDRLRFVAIDAAQFERLAAAGHNTALAITDAHQSVAAPVLRVTQAGIHASVQDLGRAGHRHLGVAAGGVCDGFAATLANALVGNAATAPVLEMTLRGPDLVALAPVTLALTGAGMRAQVDGEVLSFGRPITLAAGQTIRFQPTGQGARAWLAIAGGFAAPRWLGSAAVDFGSSAFGRALRAGDLLALAAAPAITAPADAAWWVEAAPDLDDPVILRFVADADADAQPCAELADRVWQVGHAADRSGLRLQGAPLSNEAAGARISAGVLHGSIQLPADGQPILLGPDSQTVGGYPLIGHVIEADLPLLAQLKPGDRVWLHACTLAQAHSARIAQANSLARLRVAISGKLRP